MAVISVKGIEMEVAPLAPTRSRKQKAASSGNTIWTKEEDELLARLLSVGENVQWSVISRYFPMKTPSQLSGRWEKVLNPRLVKGSWTREEDETILNYVLENGDKDWAKLAQMLSGRTGKQCRERFKNHLDPNVRHRPWDEEEDQKLIDLHKEMGNQWTKISTFFEGRTDNCVKNRWNSTLKKRIERMERGEPIVMKRGRRPKVSSSTEIAVEDQPSSPLVRSSCSSPLVKTIKSTPTLVELSAFITSLPVLQNCANYLPNAPLASLEENRKSLHQMLTQMTN